MVRLSIHEHLALDAYMTMISYQSEFKEFEIHIDTNSQRHAFFVMLKGCDIVRSFNKGKPITVTLRKKKR